MTHVGSCASAAGISRQARTAGSSPDQAPLLRVTHPFHPLAGEDVEWVSESTFRGERYAELARRDGIVQRIPSRWTSLVEEDPAVTAGEGRAHLRAQDLVALADLVGRLRR